MKKLILFLILILPLLANALKVQSYVESKRISEAEYVKLNVEISGENADDIRNFDLPKITGLQYVSRSQSSSSSFQVINGKMKSDIKKTFVFTLRPKKVGKISIPALSLKYKGKNYKTNPISLEVVKGANVQVPNSRRNTRGMTSQQKQTNVEDGLFIDVEIPKKNLYLGETLDVKYYIYNQFSIGDLSFTEEPQFDGFWAENTFSADRVSFDRVNVNGELFERMHLKTYKLTPSEIGDLTIPSMEMNVGISVGGRSFFNMGQTKDFVIKSDPKIIRVKELPKPAPSNFDGAIGVFSLTSKISSKEVKAGDSFTYTILLQGDGNFSQIDDLQLPEVSHFRFLEPEIKTESLSNGLTKRIVKYLVIPQEEGNYTIPEIKFSYFDPEQKKYKILKTNTFKIKVNEGSQFVISGGNSQQRIALEGNDIGFIISETKFSDQRNVFKSPIYWIAYLLGIGAIFFSYFKGKEDARMDTNKSYSRSKLADKVVKKYLKEAENSITDGDIFYANIQNGLINYLCDKMKISRGEESAKLIIALKQRNMIDTTLYEIEAVIKHCNEARFMPGKTNDDNAAFYARVKTLIQQISKSKLR